MGENDSLGLILLIFEVSESYGCIYIYILLVKLLHLIKVVFIQSSDVRLF